MSDPRERHDGPMALAVMALLASVIAFCSGVAACVWWLL